MKQLILLFVFLALAFSCGGDSDSSLGGGGATVSNGMTNAYSGIAGQTAKLSDLSPGSSGFTKNQSDVSIMATAFGANWSTNTNVMPDDTVNSGTTSIMEWMGHQINENAVRENGSSISILGRLKDAIGLFCALGVGIGNVDGDGYPADGSITVNITSALASQINSQCNLDASDAIGMPITFTVSTPTDTTVYDKKVVLNPPNGGTQTVYFRTTNAEINVGAVETYTLDADEDGANGNDDKLSRTTVSYDKTNGIMRAEYISGYNEGPVATNQRLETSRILYDENNDEGYILFKAYTSGNPDRTQFVLTGKPQTSGAEFALSFEHSTLDANERQACVVASTGNITGTDGTYCSAVAGVSLAGISVSSINTTLDAGYNSTNFDTISESTTLSFTSANFASAAFLTE